MKRICLGAVTLAVVLSGPLALADGPSLTSPSGSITEQAKRHFNAGVSLLQDPEGEKVEQAYREFKTAYDLSGSAKILGNMGFCAMRLERDGEAIDAYSRYLREVQDIDPDERAQIVKDLQTLTVSVARVTIDLSAPYAMVTDDRVPVRGAHVVNTYGPVLDKIDLGIRPGHHVFTARLNGKEEAVWEIEVAPGAREHHTFTLTDKQSSTAAPAAATASTPAEKPSAAGPIGLLAGGGALLVAGTITGIVALGKTGDISDGCPADRCPSGFNLSDKRSSARTFVTLTDVFLAVGTVATAVGLYWGYRVMTASSDKKAEKTGPAAAPPKPQGILSDWRLAL